MKIKTSVLAGISALLLLFPHVKERALEEIAKPYLGVYECTEATLGSKDYLERFSTIQIELLVGNKFQIIYQEKGKEKRKIAGTYCYDEERELLTLTEKTGFIKREFPIENGIITVSFPIGKKNFVAQFQQK